MKSARGARPLLQDLKENEEEEKLFALANKEERSSELDENSEVGVIDLMTAKIMEMLLEEVRIDTFPKRPAFLSEFPNLKTEASTGAQAYSQHQNRFGYSREENNNIVSSARHDLIPNPEHGDDNNQAQLFSSGSPPLP